MHTGLITASDSESEIASVLAHEIAHVTQRHIARQIGIQKQMQMPMMIAMAAALLLGRVAAGPGERRERRRCRRGAVQSQLAFSRDFEREADRLGFQTLNGSGFDVRAMAEFFEKMQRYTRLMDSGAVPAYLRSHPVTTERISDAQARAQGMPFRPHVDTLEYHLVRAKLRAEAMDPADAVKTFTAAVSDRRFANEPGARYGLAIALLRAKEYKRADAEIALLRAGKIGEPDGRHAGGARAPGAGRRGGRARAAHGRRSRAIRTAARCSTRTSTCCRASGRYDDVLAALAEPLRLYPRDPEAARGARAGLRRSGQAPAAARGAGRGLPCCRGTCRRRSSSCNSRRAPGDGNFYELSVVDARLKELRAEHARELKEARRSF